MWIRSGYKKPQSTSAHCRSLRCSASVRSFAFGSARTSFLLDAFTTYTNGWIGRGTGVSPREDNLVGLVASLQSRQGYRLAVHTFAALPPAVLRGLRSYTMKRLDDDSDLLKILRCAFETYNTLKSGYLESVYEAALEYELLQAGFSVSRQVRIPVFYKGIELKKDFYADMVVNDRIILELKAVSTINQAHEKQLQSYMKSTGIKEGMLLNFGHVRRLEWRAFSP